MNLEQFIENFSDLFDDTESSTIDATTQFKDLEEWSSLVALSVIAMIDEEYDVVFAIAPQLRTCITLSLKDWKKKINCGSLIYCWLAV